MTTKIISTIIFAALFSAFIVLPVQQSLALTIPTLSPTPSSSAGPDFNDFGSGLGDGATSAVAGGVGCAVGALLGFFGGGSDLFYCIDNFVIRPVMRTISNSIENNMLNQMGAIVTDKLGGGKDPHFVTDWRNLILNSNARGNDIFRSVLADTELCPYFGNNLKQVFGADVFGGVIKNLNGSGSLTNAPGTESFQYLNKCSLSSNIDVEAFSKDFTQGGWAAWLELSRPENKISTVLTRALEERSKQVELEEEAAKDEALAGNGFLPKREDFSSTEDSGSGSSSEDCDDYALNQCNLTTTRNSFGTNYHSQSQCINEKRNECVKRSSPTKPSGASGCAGQGILTRCTFQGKAVTPGALFGDATKRILDQKFETIGGSEEIQDLILALSDLVVNKLSGRLNNFLGSGSKINSTPSNTNRSICMANCEINAFLSCSGSLVLETETAACMERTLTACQQSCPK